MISREQIKREIDLVNDAYLEILYQIVRAFKLPTLGRRSTGESGDINPLKGSVTFESDLISPIDESWNANA